MKYKHSFQNPDPVIEYWILKEDFKVASIELPRLENSLSSSIHPIKVWY